MNSDFQLKNKTIFINIRKPLYGTFVYIRDTYLNKAINNNYKIIVTIPQGSAEIDPKEWIANGKRITKVFLRPDEPMVLWGGYVPIKKEEEKKPVEKKPTVKQEELF